MPHVLSTYNGGADVGFTAEELMSFAGRWPCFGAQTSPENWRDAVLRFGFDRIGDLVEVHGDEGLDERAVAALADEAREYGRTCAGMDNWLAR